MVWSAPSWRALLQFALVARGGDDLGGRASCNLNGSRADAGARAQHQNRLTSFQVGAANQHVPGGKENEGNAGGLLEVQSVRDGDDVDPGHGDQLAVTAVDAIAQHSELRAEILASAIALLAMAAEDHRRQKHPRAFVEIGDVLAAVDYFAGNVAAQDVRQLHAGQSLAHKQVEMVEGAGAHSNQDLILAQDGSGMSSYFNTSGPPNS